MSDFILDFFDAFSQDFSIQGQNELRAADGIEYVNGDFSSKKVFENRLNLDAYYKNFRLGTRYTVLDPSEFGQTYSGIGSINKRFLEYSSSKYDINVRLGDFTTVWGRGLTLGLVEDIDQGFDSGLDGFKAATSWNRFETEVIYGYSEEAYLRNVRQAELSGAHLAYTLFDGYTFGLQTINVKPYKENSYDQSDTWGGYFSYDGSYFSLWLEQARENISGLEDEDFGASYASLSGFYGSLGWMIDYKNYNYYLYSASSGTSDNPYTQSVEILPFHSSPIVQREFTSNLFGKHPHIIDYDDEVGIQIELTWAPGDLGTFILATSQSSAHDVDNSPWPTLNEEDGPYRELFFEFSTYPTPESFINIWSGYSEELLFEIEGDEGHRLGWDDRWVLGSKYERPIITDWSSIIYAEMLSTRKEKNSDREFSFSDYLVSLGAVYKANYTFIASLEMTAEEDPSEPPSDFWGPSSEEWFGMSKWFNVQARAFIADRHELMVTIGEERGGLVCTSGKCRVVTPFNGVKVSLISLF